MDQPPDWLMRTESDKVAVSEGCYYDQSAVDRVAGFFPKFLRHSKGQFAKKPFDLLEWEHQRLIAPTFGWRMPDGTRRFREVACAVAKKNGKSTLLSGLGIYGLVGDGEPGPEVYCAAADRNQASIIYTEAANMIDVSPALRKRLDPVRSGKKIHYPEGQGLMMALSADVPTKEGLNWSMLLFDELHAQANPDLYNTLKYGGAARRQPLLLWITTAGVDRESICYQKWERARDIRDGRVIDIRTLPVLFEPDEHDAWDDPETWKKANPSLGVTMSLDSFRLDFKEAMESAALENIFKRYRLNLWTEQITRWIQLADWKACRDPNFRISLMRGMPVWGGLDLATTTDIAAFCMLFKLPEARWGLSFRFWVPEDTIEKRVRENRTRIDQWVKCGQIIATPGNVIDYEIIRRDINAMLEGHNVQEIAIDPWNATQLALQLQGDGFKVEFVRSGFYSIAGATREFEKCVLGKKFTHNAGPVMDWMVNNVAVEHDASGNMKPSKRHSGEKIDGVMAVVLAMARATADEGPKTSKYERGGLFGV